MTDTIIDRTDNSGAPSSSQLHRDKDGNEETASHICHFIHPEHGRRCGSPALRNEPFCYHHNEERPRPANPGERKRRRNTFDLAAPDSRTAIQDALGSIFLRIAENEIDLRRAGLLLYTLQIDSANLTAAEKEQPQSTHVSVECPIHDAASSRHEWDPQPQRSDRAAIQDALGNLFPRIDDQQLEPRRAGLLLYCLQIASANLKAQQARETAHAKEPRHAYEIHQTSKTHQEHETHRLPHPSCVPCDTDGNNTATAPHLEPQEQPFELQSALDDQAAKISEAPKARPIPAWGERGPRRACSLGLEAPDPGRVSVTSAEGAAYHPASRPSSDNNFGDLSHHKTCAQEALTNSRPISRSTFAALLEALARRQGIDVEKLNQAHDATILLRLNAVAEHPQNASAPSIPQHHRGTNGVADLLTRYGFPRLGGVLVEAPDSGAPVLTPSWTAWNEIICFSVS